MAAAKKDYSEEALREALLNSLVHRDYAYSASTLHSIFVDRTEFVSIRGEVKGISIEDPQKPIFEVSGNAFKISLPNKNIENKKICCPNRDKLWLV